MVPSRIGAGTALRTRTGHRPQRPVRVPDAMTQPSSSPAPPATSAAACSPSSSTHGHDVRALVRDPAKADLPGGARIAEGDVIERRRARRGARGRRRRLLPRPLDGRRHGRDFAERDRRGARELRQRRARAGVERVVYLGGLEAPGDASEHLRSREEVARDPRASTSPSSSTSARRWSSAPAAPRSRCCATLVERLPAMITPRWLDTRTQPVAIDDVVAHARRARRPRGPARRGPARRRRRPHLPRDDGALRRDRRASASRSIVKRPGAHPAAVVVLGRARHAGRPRARAPARRRA